MSALLTSHHLPIVLALIASASLAGASPTSAQAQLDPSLCVYRVGNNPGWSAADLDQAGWKSYADYQETGAPVVWVRCRILIPLQSFAHPAIEIYSHDAVEGFVNGQSVGGYSQAWIGWWTSEALTNSILRVPAGLLHSAPQNASATFAVRIRQHRLPAGSWAGLPATFSLGDSDSLMIQSTRGALDSVRRFVPAFSMFLIVAVAGVLLICLFLFDRSRKDPLWLGLFCLCAGLARVDSICAATMPHFPSWLFETWWGLTLFDTWFAVLFFFAIAGRRMPALYRLPLWATVLFNVAIVAAILMPLQFAVPFSLFFQGAFASYVLFPIYVFAFTAPLVAFWPWNRLASRLRLPAVLCACWGLMEIVFLGQQILFGRQTWTSPVQTYLTFAIVGVVVWLLYLTFREHRTTGLEGATLRGELAAAGQIQRLLVPEKLDAAPWVAIEAAFLPARDVGGDFYRCRRLVDGTQRVLLGDVSGKGLAAALTSALLIGAADRCDHLSPAAVLSDLNRTLEHSGIGGFTTCLCADIAPDGSLVVANAGHLSPYRNGVEFTPVSGIPLGISAEMNCPESCFQLESGDQITFMSDGVIEARGPARELFGFDRACSLSTRSAQEIAQAAQAFGQEDDITVLTVMFSPVMAPVADALP